MARPITLPSRRTACVLLSDGRCGLAPEILFEDVDPDELAADLGFAASHLDDTVAPMA